MRNRLLLGMAQSSLYGRIVALILSISMIFFAFLSVVVYYITSNYMEEVIYQSGRRVISLVDQSLRHDMLTSQHTEFIHKIQMLQDTPGLSSINIYDTQGKIRYSGLSDGDPEADQSAVIVCGDCHNRPQQTAFSVDQPCTFTKGRYPQRELIVLAPILNHPNCSSQSCHAHADQDRMLGFLEVRFPLNDVDAAMNQTLLNFLVGAILVTGMLIVSILLFTQRRVQRPLEQIIDASRKVSAGQLDLQLQLSEKDPSDIRGVETAFNQMLTTIAHRDEELRRWSRELEDMVRERTENLERAQHEIYHIERLASMGKLSSSVAHEINNPLAGVLTYSKLISRMLTKLDIDGDRKASMLAHLVMIESETRRCGDIVKGLMEFSREDQEEQEIIDLNPVLIEVVKLMEHSFQMADVTLETEFEDTVPLIKANPNQIKQACMAILMNALEAVPQIEGRVLFRSLDSTEGHAAIQIADNGTGIDPADQAHIFEPFFTRKKPASGIGLGLAVTYGIINRHDGMIQVNSMPGRGTTLTITLPAFKPQENENHVTET